MRRSSRRLSAGSNLLSALRIIGHPVFLVILYIASFFAALFLLSRTILKKFSRINFKVPKPSFPHFPDLKYPKIKSFKFTKPAFPNVKWGVVFLILVSFIGLFYFYYQILYQLPSVYSLKEGPKKLTTQILDRNGKLLYKIYQDENRTPINLSDLPYFVKDAFISIEDNKFYDHPGFSIVGILRAFTRNLHTLSDSCQQSNAENCSLEGGSTITQQLVKNALLSSEKTWQRKVKEIILAIQTEIIYDKDTILEMYLNQVGFGGPAYGIQEASQQYFGIDAKNLNLSQAAFLAGLPKAPSKFSPYINPKLAISRQHLVLNQMFKNKTITQEQLNNSLNESLNFNPSRIEINAPHFVMYIRDLLVDQFGESLVSHGGLKVTTSLDLDLQLQTEELVNKELSRLKNLNVNNGAALITTPSTGEILAMVGSRNYFDLETDGQVNLTTSPRQAGSSLKPINYALALEKGLGPNTLIKDEPISFNIPGSGTWTPKNYDNRFHGVVTLRSALANSYNIPAILLLARNGVNNMVSLGKQMGITTWDQPANRFGLSLTLGSVEVKMTDMVVVYGTFANNGQTVPLNPILKIESNQNNSLVFDLCTSFPNNCSSRQSISSNTAFLISDILSDNIARASAFGYNSVLNLGKFKAAVKTGTSNDLRDNWAFGFTPNYVVATWVGNNDNSPMSHIASGITGASPIWANIMKSLLTTNPQADFITPDSLVKVPICTLTGTLTCTGCPTRYEFFEKGNEPKTACDPQAIQEMLKPSSSPDKPRKFPPGQILDGLTTYRSP